MVAVALAAARELGFTVLACPSTGNLANAVAAAAARAGIRSVVLIPPTSSSRRSSPPRSTAARWSPSRAPTTTSTGSPPSSPASTRTGRSSTSTSGPTTPRAPRRSGYEVAEQLGWRLPEQIVIPVASGSQLTKVDKAFGELASSGWSRRRRTGSSARRPPGARRCGGLQGRATTWCAGAARHHRQVAGHRQPADGPYVLDTARRTGGAVEDVTDDEVVEGIRLLARTEGIFAETAGGVTVAALRKLVRDGRSTPTPRRSSSTPATASRRWTPSRRSPGPWRPSGRR